MNILVNANERLLKANLKRWGHTVLTCASGDDALNQLLRPDSPNLAILQHGPGLPDGLGVCRKIREIGLEPYKYFILLTTGVEKDDLLEALEQGADDCLAKPLDGFELRAKLLVATRILDLQDRMTAISEELKSQALHDPLTGLFNRRAMMEFLGRELDRTSRDKTPVGISIIDIDKFKRLNDTLGHLVGDEVMTEVSSLLKNTLRSYDIVGRFGGDEFMVILPGCHHSAIGERMENVRQACASKIFQTSQGPVRITLTIGAATASTRVSAVSLIKAADDALFRGKKAGRNWVEVAERILVPAAASADL